MPLTKDEIAQVVRLQVGNVQKMLAAQDVSLEVTPHAVNYLAEVGFDPEFGARPVKRAIQRYMLNDLSKRLLAGEVSSGPALRGPRSQAVRVLVVRTQTPWCLVYSRPPPQGRARLLGGKVTTPAVVWKAARPGLLHSWVWGTEL